MLAIDNFFTDAECDEYVGLSSQDDTSTVAMVLKWTAKRFLLRVLPLALRRLVPAPRTLANGRCRNSFRHLVLLTTPQGNGWRVQQGTPGET